MILLVRLVGCLGLCRKGLSKIGKLFFNKYLTCFLSLLALLKQCFLKLAVHSDINWMQDIILWLLTTVRDDKHPVKLPQIIFFILSLISIFHWEPRLILKISNYFKCVLTFNVYQVIEAASLCCFQTNGFFIFLLRFIFNYESGENSQKISPLHLSFSSFFISHLLSSLYSLVWNHAE